MFSTLRTKFGIPGVISVIALVFALAGGAFAANNSDDSGATASAKAKKGPKGAKGATGPAGPAGPAGAAGAPGPKGDAGTNGTNGTDGTDGEDGEDGQNGQNGQNGTSVTASVEPKGANCKEGGVKFQSASPTAYACNGSPWTAGGTLPSGQTETGIWTYGGDPNPQGNVLVSVPFAIPLAAELDESHVHFLNKSGKEVGTEYNANLEPEGGFTSTACLGTASAPQAAPGHLCIYAGHFSATNLPPNPHVMNSYIKKVGANQESGASTFGAYFWVEEPGSNAIATGSWAVTAP